MKASSFKILCPPLGFCIHPPSSPSFLCPAVAISFARSSNPPTLTTSIPTSANRLTASFLSTNVAGSPTPQYTVLTPPIPPRLLCRVCTILSTQLAFPLSRNTHGSMLVYSTAPSSSDSASPTHSGVKDVASAYLASAHCSACVLPGSSSV